MKLSDLDAAVADDRESLYQFDRLADNFGMDNTKWFYRMINSKKPLQEKMTLFWHHVFATGWTKSEQGPTMIDHIAMLTPLKKCCFRIKARTTLT